MSKQLLRVFVVFSGDEWLNEAAVIVDVLVAWFGDWLVVIQSVSIAFDALRLKCSRKLSIWTSIELGVLAIVLFFFLLFFLHLKLSQHYFNDYSLLSLSLSHFLLSFRIQW